MSQTAANPYQRPGAPVDDEAAEEFSEVKVLSAAGRLGRVRYIGYSIGISLVFYAVIAMGGALTALTGVEILGGAIIIAAVIGMLVIGVMLTIQRCHDFDVSGWLSLLLIVPIAPLLFWIIPGSKGANRFGGPTPPNSTGVVILALLLPVLFFGGILAAIALPAYQDYTKRARMVEEMQRQSQMPEPAVDEGLDEAGIEEEGIDEEVAEGDEESGDVQAGDEEVAVEPAADESAAPEPAAVEAADAEAAHARVAQ
jgi:uncharacterized membrane protein YhaH (DUF805 family)/Tfp pilus assembly major pilin PilA